MHILQIGTSFGPIPPKGAVGAERTIDYLSAALVALGNQVTVLDIQEKNRPPTPYQVEEVLLHWHWKTNWDSSLLTHVLRGLFFRQASKGKLIELLRNGCFDIVHFHNQFPAWHIPLVQRYNLPAVYTIHSGLWSDPKFYHPAWRIKLRSFQKLRALRKADAVICVNKAAALNLSRCLGIPATKIAVIPHGIAEDWFADIAVPKDIKDKYAHYQEHIILNVARVAPYKNQLTLAQAIPLVLKEIPNTRFIFAGPIADKSYFRKILHFITKAGITPYVTFTGETPHLELPQLYSLCEVFAMPSCYEAFPLVLLEAMASGKPIIASDIEAFQDKLGEGRGITVPASDHVALARAIIALLQNKSRREQMGQKAKEHARDNYTWETTAKKTAQVYKKVIKGD